MEVIEKLNLEFSDLQDKYFNLEVKYNKTLYHKVLVKLKFQLIDRRFRNLEKEQRLWNENSYLSDTNDKTNNLLMELYNWNEFTCDDWYRKPPWTKEWEYAPYGVPPDRREQTEGNVWINGF